MISLRKFKLKEAFREKLCKGSPVEALELLRHGMEALRERAKGLPEDFRPDLADFEIAFRGEDGDSEDTELVLVARSGYLHLVEWIMAETGGPSVKRYGKILDALLESTSRSRASETLFQVLSSNYKWKMTLRVLIATDVQN